MAAGALRRDQGQNGGGISIQLEHRPPGAISWLLSILAQRLALNGPRISELLTTYLESSGNPELENHGEINGATNLVSDLTLDSFQVMEFLMDATIVMEI